MSDITEDEARIAELRRSLGEEHPETLAAMLDLAERLWAAGRLGTARALEEQVVATRLKQFGDPRFLFGNIVHPCTLPPRRGRSKPCA